MHFSRPIRVRHHLEGAGHAQQEPPGLLPGGARALPARRARANPEFADPTQRPVALRRAEQPRPEDPAGEVLHLQDRGVSPLPFSAEPFV